MTALAIASHGHTSSLIGFGGCRKDGSWLEPDSQLKACTEQLHRAVENYVESDYCSHKSDSTLVKDLDDLEMFGNLKKREVKTACYRCGLKHSAMGLTFQEDESFEEKGACTSGVGTFFWDFAMAVFDLLEKE